MLAENFKTPVELGIPDEHRRALVLCLRYLESGKVKHALNYQRVSGERPRLFNMCEWSVVTECGTVCCIGGWAEYLGGISDLGSKAALDPLFYPNGIEDWNQITPEKAAIVVRHYLTTGEICWSLALAPV